MRRAGHNPTDIEVQDLINKIDSDAGTLSFQVDEHNLCKECPIIPSISCYSCYMEACWVSLIELIDIEGSRREILEAF